MGYSSELQAVLDTYENLYMPDKMPLLITLASMAGSKFEGDPVHLFIIGPASGGKNLILESFLDVPKTFHITTFNESSLLSATGKRDRAANATGGLLKRIGDIRDGPGNGEGTLIFTEFNNILSMHPDTRRETLAALHQVASGMYDRDRGSDGGMNLSWRGKVQVIAASTQQIEEHLGQLSKVGERFIYCRMPNMDRAEQLKYAAINARNGANQAYKQERVRATSKFFSNLKITSCPEDYIEPEDEEILCAMADFSTLARSPVPRNDKTREIEFVYDSEQPARMYQSLQRLLCGLRVIGVPFDESLRLVARTALSAMPGLRKVALRSLVSQLEMSNTVTVQDIKEQAPYYSETTIRRSLEELEVHGIVARSNGHTNYWVLTEDALSNWYTAFRKEDLN